MRATESNETLVQCKDPAYTYGIIHPTPFPFRGSPMMPSSSARPIDRTHTGTAAALSRIDTLRLADGTLVEHRLLAMADDLWAERPEALDPHWRAVAWRGLTIAYRIDT